MLEKIALWNFYEKEEEEDVAASQPAQPKKRARLEDDETDETAEEAPEYHDTHYPIAADDPDRLRFQGRIRSLIDTRSEEDMPTAQWIHRLTYLDIAVDVGPSKICMMPTILHPTTPMKVLKPGVQIQPLYGGQSLRWLEFG
ncbi:hypothetical protein LRP88_13377 [Fusarium phalaenopsidis]